jgi:uncharacterized membrane protein YdbT with pleckstrin-like domain
VADAQSEHSGEEVLFEGRPALVPSLGVLLLSIVTLGLWLLPRWWHRGATLYRVTTRRVVFETGVLSKRLKQLDLHRIADYEVERPFGQRLLGTGNLILKTFDKNEPVLDISEVKTDVVALYERLRLATDAERKRRGVGMLDIETRA